MVITVMAITKLSAKIGQTDVNSKPLRYKCGRDTARECVMHGMADNANFFGRSLLIWEIIPTFAPYPDEHLHQPRRSCSLAIHQENIHLD